MEESIGKKIAAQREVAGMSVEELAQTLELEVGEVLAWERGEAKPSSDNLLQVAIALNVTQDELLGEPYTDDGEIFSPKRIEKDQDLFKLICRTMALAMGVAVTVLSVLEQIAPDAAIAMLGIGMTCLGISSFTRKK